MAGRLPRRVLGCRRQGRWHRNDGTRGAGAAPGQPSATVTEAGGGGVGDLVGIPSLSRARGGAFMAGGGTRGRSRRRQVVAQTVGRWPALRRPGLTLTLGKRQVVQPPRSPLPWEG